MRPPYNSVTASVIIPCRNKLGTIGAVLRTLAGQSFPASDFEVVVVDDGSTDGTRELVRKLAETESLRVVVEELPHVDVCPARVRNAGLARARGEIVIFVDADVLVGPDFVAEHVAAHRASATDAAVIGYIHAYPLEASKRAPEVLQAPPIDQVLDRLPELLRADPKRWQDGREAHYRIWPDLGPMPWWFFWSGNSSVRRQVAEAVGGFDTAFRNWGYEDIELGYRLWKRGLAFALHRPAWGFHYPHPTGSDDQRFINLMQFLAKHPEPTVELNCFSVTRFQAPGAARVRWEILDRLKAPVAPAPAPSGALCAALLEFARARRPGPCAWFGELPGALPAPPELVSHPFRPHAAPGQAALAGLALPHGDGTFASALAIDYWQTLSPAARRFLCAELTRVADSCILVSLDPPSAPVVDPGPGLAVTPVAVPGAHMQVVRQS
jgi:glycosyltransferase involved in cell wall biosynthesis